MINIDPDEFVRRHRDALFAEAEQERLAALLPVRSPFVASALRRELALACYRLATWLDDPARYLQTPDAGPEDWVSPWASV